MEYVVFPVSPKACACGTLNVASRLPIIAMIAIRHISFLTEYFFVGLFIETHLLVYRKILK
jgi:hypothetical protein